MNSFYVCLPINRSRLHFKITPGTRIDNTGNFQLDNAEVVSELIKNTVSYSTVVLYCIFLRIIMFLLSFCLKRYIIDMMCIQISVL